MRKHAVFISSLGYVDVYATKSSYSVFIRNETFETDSYIQDNNPDRKCQALFLRLYPESRPVTSKGISLFGMHYWSPKLQQVNTFDRQGKRIAFGIRYNTADLSEAVLFDEKKLVCTVRAKELHLANNEYRQVSIWEHKLAQDLARGERQSTRDWLAYINELRATHQKRIAEKKKIRRELLKTNAESVPEPDAPKVAAALQERTPAQVQEYASRLARWGRH